ncbi:SpdD-like protein [Streptomyces sp. NPDC026206]|uniref:SpdD-like protein n=1 Tax=Streptomyces sp. NPDC026206 TaxID=3157089 RepID=UPI0033D5B87F
MLRPRVPTNPLPTTTALTTNMELQPQPAQVICQHHAQAPATPARGGVRLTAGATVAAIGAGAIGVLVIGAVLVGMFLAISITAGSLAVVAVVTRSMLNSQSKR